MCGILGKECAPSTSAEWLRVGEATSELSLGRVNSPSLLPASLGWSQQGEERAAIPATTGSLTCSRIGAGNNTVGCSDPSSPEKLLQMSSARVEGMGKSSSPQPNHPTQLQSPANYPSLWYSLSSPVLYSPDSMPGPLFPSHLYLSCLPAWLVVCPFSTSPFVPSTPHLRHYNSQASISVTADTKAFISLILQFPIITYTEFSTVAHSFTTPHFEQF